MFDQIVKVWNICFIDIGIRKFELAVKTPFLCNKKYTMCSLNCTTQLLGLLDLSNCTKNLIILCLSWPNIDQFTLRTKSNVYIQEKEIYKQTFTWFLDCLAFCANRNMFKKHISASPIVSFSARTFKNVCKLY